MPRPATPKDHHLPPGLCVRGLSNSVRQPSDYVGPMCMSQRRHLHGLHGLTSGVLKCESTIFCNVAARVQAKLLAVIRGGTSACTSGPGYEKLKGRGQSSRSDHHVTLSLLFYRPCRHVQTTSAERLPSGFLSFKRSSRQCHLHQAV